MDLTATNHGMPLHQPMYITSAATNFRKIVCRNYFFCCWLSFIACRSLRDVCLLFFLVVGGLMLFLVCCLLFLDCFQLFVSRVVLVCCFWILVFLFFLVIYYYYYYYYYFVSCIFRFLFLVFCSLFTLLGSWRLGL